jgi:hypothetical protein
MLKALQDLAIRVSRTWWLYLLVVALFAGSLVALNRIGDAFPAHAAGMAPFDLQNDLQASQVYPQIAGYTDRARELYLAFTAIDYGFPFFAGLFIMATLAAALRYAAPGLYTAMVSRTLLPLPMLATVCDWLENVAAAAAVWLYPAELSGLPVALVLAKKAKLAVAGAANLAMGLAVLAALGRWLQRLFRR